MARLLGKIVRTIKGNRQVSTFLICLLLSLALWFFTSYGNDYEYSVSYPVTFVDSGNRVEYYTRDSVITVTVKANAFQYMFYSKEKGSRHLTLDIDKLNINLSKGKASIQSIRLRNQIVNDLGYEGKELKISPQNIEVRWKKVFSRRIPVAMRCSFSYDRPCGEYYPPRLEQKYVTAEGSKDILSQIDSVYTQPVSFEHVTKNTSFIVPLDLQGLPENVSIPQKFAVVSCFAERFTEDIVMLPVDVVSYTDCHDVRVLPRKVKVRYRVAEKDYFKFNTQEFKAFVELHSSTAANDGKLKVNIKGVPDYIHIKSIYPEKVEYILFE